MVLLRNCLTKILRSMSKISPEQREFLKVKRFIQKRFPGAYTIQRTDGSFAVVGGNGISIVDPELMLPPTYTVRKAWEQAKYVHWFSNMMRKSNNAFSDEKIYKSMNKGDRSNW